MRRVSLFVSIFALCGAGLMAQDDLAQYQDHMKAVQAANGALNKAVADKDSAGIATNSANAVTNLEWIANYFQQKGKEDGVTFAKNSAAAFKAVGDAKTPEDQTAAAQKIRGTCGACHMVYRAGTAFKGM